MIQLRTARRLGHTTTAVSAVVVALTLILVVVNSQRIDAEALVVAAIMMACIAVGEILVVRRTSNVIGWLLAATGLLIAVSSLAGEYVRYALVVAPDTMPGAHLAKLATYAFFGWITVAGCLVPLLFPTGRPLTPRWRWPAWVGLGGLGLQFVAAAPSVLAQSRDELLSGAPPVTDDVLLRAATLTGLLLLLTAIIGAVTSAIVRYHRARGIERLQLKWFLYAVGVAATGTITELIAASTLSLVLIGFGFVGIPVAIGVAIMRYRLYDIDRIISRTVSYGLLTTVLAAVYFGSVVAVRGLMPRTGPLAVAASTLAIAALFRPVRSRLQSATDRRFNRTAYDARQTVDSFAQRMRTQIDISELADELQAAAINTVEPCQISLWLPYDRRAHEHLLIERERVDTGTRTRAQPGSVAVKRRAVS